MAGASIGGDVVCEACSAGYVDHVGEPLPDSDEFNSAWLERAMTTLETVLVTNGAALEDNGRQLALMSQQATLIAFGELLIERGCCVLPGWIALLGTHTANGLGVLPHQLEAMPEFMRAGVKARVKAMIEHVGRSSG